jgi:hypothetical protein
LAQTSKLYPYIIVLRNETSKYINITGFILTTGSAILFLQQMLLRGAIILPYLAGVIFIAGLLLWNAYVYFKKGEQIYFSKALLIAGLVWTRMPYFEWLVIVFAILAVLEYQAKLPPEIGFSDEHIVFNGLIKKKYDWSAIDNVILKDELLTIDFKNNTLFQKEIDSGDNEATEEEFNGWCARLLLLNHEGTKT